MEALREVNLLPPPPPPPSAAEVAADRETDRAGIERHPTGRTTFIALAGVVTTVVRSTIGEEAPHTDLETAVQQARAARGLLLDRLGRKGIASEDRGHFRGTGRSIRWCRFNLGG